jgi:Holliday junction resolvase
MNTRGRQRELAVAVLLRDAGFIAYRLAHGNADVAAMRHDHQPMLIQVKSTAGGPYERFGPYERAALLLEAEQAGAAAVLAWWPPRRRVPKWIDSSDWPALRAVA